MLRVVFCNIYMLPYGYTSGNSVRASFLAEQLSKTSPDIILCCEAYDKRASSIVASDLQHIHGYSYVVIGDRGLMFASRVQVLRWKRVTFRNTGTFADKVGKKGVMVIELPTVIVMLTHLDAKSKEVRERQIEEVNVLARSLGPKQCVLVGDLNTKIKSLSEKDNAEAFRTCLQNGIKKMNGSTMIPGECNKWPLDWAIIITPGPIKKVDEKWEAIEAPVEFTIRKGNLGSGPLVLTRSLSDHPKLDCKFY